MEQTLHIEIKGPPASGKTTFMRVLSEMLKEHDYRVDQTQEHELAVSWLWSTIPYGKTEVMKRATSIIEELEK